MGLSQEDFEDQTAPATPETSAMIVASEVTDRLTNLGFNPHTLLKFIVHSERTEFLPERTVLAKSMFYKDKYGKRSLAIPAQAKFPVEADKDSPTSEQTPRPYILLDLESAKKNKRGHADTLEKLVNDTGAIISELASFSLTKEHQVLLRKAQVTLKRDKKIPEDFHLTVSNNGTGLGYLISFDVPPRRYQRWANDFGTEVTHEGSTYKFEIDTNYYPDRYPHACILETTRDGKEIEHPVTTDDLHVITDVIRPVVQLASEYERDAQKDFAVLKSLYDHSQYSEQTNKALFPPEDYSDIIAR